ncbi:MAG: hypothetical protein QGI83_24310 [Candidatus Latescibacteria bacterium]|nr:hypothetical protein [Candidatus Latescibacterota bacterium]
MSARTHYVAPNGSDRGAGSEEAPFATVQHAADVARSEDRVLIKTGTYYERVVVRNSGTTFEGERGADGSWQTVIDGSEPISGWSPADGLANGVYQTTDPGYEPYTMLSNNKQIPRIKNPSMEADGLEKLQRPSDFEVELPYDGGTIRYWDGIEALFRVHEGTTFIRFRDGAHPDTMGLRTGPEEPVILIRDKSEVVIRDLRLQGGYYSVLIEGEGACNNIVEQNDLLHGKMNVYVRDLASGNHIRHNEMKPHIYACGDPFPWETGAWGGAQQTDYRYAIRQNFYSNSLKRNVTATDRCVFLINAGDDNEVYGNLMRDGIGGVGTEVTATTNYTLEGRASKARYGRNLKIYDNVIHNMSSTGIRTAGGEANLQVYGNAVYDCNINFRIHDPSVGPIYIYRNRFVNPQLGNTHMYRFFRGPDDYEFPLSQYVHPDIYIYHNSFAGGSHALRVSGYGGRMGGIPNTLLLNNIMDVPNPVSLQRSWEYDGPASFAHMDYNWTRQELREGWGGAHNIVSPEAAWTAYPPDFGSIPLDARGTGLDLTRPFRAGGKDYAPLPGPSHGPGPDMGALQVDPVTERE